MRPARRLAAAILALFAGASAAVAATPLLTVQARLEAQGAGRGTLRLQATLAEGWHVNSHTPSEDYLIPTAARLEPAAGVTFGDARYPDGVLHKFAFSEKPLSVYEKEFAIDVPVSWSGSATPEISGAVEYQACNDRQCNPPASAAFKTASAAGGSAAANLPGGAVALSQGSASGAAAARPASGGGGMDFGALLERKGLLGALLIVFGWGLLLNLTPCVYPVIPLTIGFFGGQTQGPGRGGRAFGLAGLYVLGMATMYSALGVAAALSGRLFGAALQSPWVLAAVAAVLVALALSMFGFFEIRMPSAWMQKAGARAGGAGAYGMGLLVGVVAAPCIGPVVLALLAFVAARQDAAFGFLVFFVLSLGLGLPYLFLAAFSGSLSRLPRAGEWMEGIKKIFGWVLLAMAAYFLRTVVPAPAGAWLMPVVLVAGALFLALGGRRLGGLAIGARAAAVVLMIGAAAFFAPRRAAAAAAPAWKPYVPETVARTGRAAVVDFAATWCIPCLELDEKTFTDPRVREALARRDLWKADMTRTAAPEVVALAEKYRILGVPTVLFLDADGREREELRLVGFEGPDEFLKRLEKAP
ncbi:MAG TPA: cytochrome c biogenesis protein CcdA [Thermoanaerobaculia bacterium]